MTVELDIVTAKAILKTLEVMSQNDRIRVLVTRLDNAIKKAKNDAHARRVSDVRRRFHGNDK